MKKTFPPLYLILSLMALLGCNSLLADSLKISAGATVRVTGEVEGDYTTSHVFVDEVAGDQVPITFFFDPETLGVESVELFTNLNRRERAMADADGDAIHDGIKIPNGNLIPPGSDAHYYKPHAMNLVSGGYQLTLLAEKTGAYRVTVRYRLNGDAADTYRWYSGRDHAVVVSPVMARDIRLYEVNTLNIEASGSDFAGRSTFEDLSDRSGALHTAPGRPNDWNLQYVKDLGINWLWFQPYHPYGWEGRHLSAANINDRVSDPNASTTWFWNNGTGTSEDVNFPFALGSPYAVKNFWEIEPRMSAAFAGDPTDINDVSSPANRAAAMTAFQNFVADADAQGVNIMPDAAFNHSAWDVELGPAGVTPANSWMAAQGASGWNATDLIHDREVRVFSRAGDYRLRATYYNSFEDNNLAPAPDRNDFGKWLDVIDIFFGRYAALVGAQDGSETANYNNEGDWIDTTEYAYGSNGSDPTGGGSFDAFTRATWMYFANYAPYWLEKTRGTQPNRNSLPADGDAAARYTWDARGIDGLRCDFGQGLPPQAWEYIINVARSYKWRFVFMAETLDGGAPPYRSNRHFDVLNENILFAAKGAGNRNDFIGMFESRRAAFGQGLVLLNTVSHDEDNYNNPWDALARFAIFSTVDGAPMIFPGQELGISTFYGYDLMEKNFGKYIPHFKTYNSMMPLWTDAAFGNDQLFRVYAAINQARADSPALRSGNRWFMYGNGNNNQIYAVAKFDQPGQPLAQQDVVLAFTNLDLANNQSDTFVIDGGLAGQMGIQDERIYNVKNVAAYENGDIGMENRRDDWLWGSGISGANLTSTGFFVQVKRLPHIDTTVDPPGTTTDAAWNQNPYEAQYLKVVDVTAPAAAPQKPAVPKPFNYELGTAVTFDWEALAADAGGVLPHYEVTVTVNDVVTETVVVSDSAYQVNGAHGDEIRITVKAVNPDEPAHAGPLSPVSETITLLDPAGDQDSDNQSNENEFKSGTNPLDPGSVFQVVDPVMSGDNISFTVEVVPGYQYTVKSTINLSDTHSWANEDEPNAVNYLPGPSEFEYIFTDLAPATLPKFYRVLVETATP